MKKRFGIGVLTSLVMAVMLMMGIVFGGSVLAEDVTSTSADTSATVQAAPKTYKLEDIAVNGSIVATVKSSSGQNVADSGVTVSRTDKLTLDLSYEIKNKLDDGTKVLTSADSLTYAFPSQVNFPSQSGYVYDGQSRAGTFSISGNVATIQLYQSFLDSNDDIKGTLTASFTLVSTETASSDKVSFTFPGVSDQTTVHFNESQVTGTKTNKVNSDGTVDFTIKLTPDSDVKDVMLSDTMGSDFTYKAGSMTLDGQTIDDPQWTNNAFTGYKVGDLTKGSHTIQYRATINDISTSNDKNKNQADWTLDLEQQYGQ